MHLVLRAALLFLLSIPVLAQNAGFALKPGDRVVFFGDSITEQKLYTSYVQQFVISRFPDMDVTFINSGWGGDTVNGNPCAACEGVGALARIERDVVAYRPTVVTLLFGMNDGLYKDFDPDVMKTYTDGLSQIIAILKRETKARIYVMTPTVYDGTRHTSWSHTDKYNSVLDKYSEAAKEIARRESLPVIDLHTVTTVALAAAKKSDKDYTFLDDGVHPGPDGQAVIAAEIVRAWGAPEEGTVIKGDAGKGDDGGSITQSAPLPWPAIKLSDRIKNADPTVAKIGDVTLKLSGVQTGTYQVSIDHKMAGNFTSQQLADGISLSALSEVAQAESSALAKAVRDKEDLEFMRWRTIGVRHAELKSSAETMAALQKLTDEQFAVARSKAKFHKYEITLTKQGTK